MGDDGLGVWRTAPNRVVIQSGAARWSLIFGQVSIAFSADEANRGIPRRICEL